MARYATPRTSVYLGIALLGLMLLLAGAHPLDARGEPSSTDLSTYIVDGSGYELPQPSQIVLRHEGNSVKLRGPITVGVGGTQRDLDNPQGEVITLGIGETRTFVNQSRSDVLYIDLLSVGGTASTQGTTNTTTSQTGQTTSTTQKGSSGLAELFFGLPNAEDVQRFAQANGDLLSIPASLAQGQAAESRFIKVLTGADGSTADYPNLTKAANMFKYIQALVGLKDDAGKPLFPSFQSKGIQALLARMTIAAARDAKNSAPLEALGSFLAGMDMAKYKPAAGQ